MKTLLVIVLMGSICCDRHTAALFEESDSFPPLRDCVYVGITLSADCNEDTVTLWTIKRNFHRQFPIPEVQFVEYWLELRSVHIPHCEEIDSRIRINEKVYDLTYEELTELMFEP